jgi:hypothetical protein
MQSQQLPCVENTRTRDAASGVPFSYPLRAAMVTASILLRLFVELIGMKWITRFDERVLCIASTPVAESARMAVIETWRRDAASWALWGTVAKALVDSESPRITPETARPFAIQGGRRLGLADAPSSPYPVSGPKND